MRVSLIDFINTWPLTWGFRTNRIDEVEAFHDVPARCGERLARGEADAGLVPVASAATLPQLRMVRGLGIAARQRVRSVLLVATRPIASVRSVGLDRSSRSSAALVRLLFREKYRRSVDFREGPPDLEALLAWHDAALLIGDPALALRPDQVEGRLVLDLASEWSEWTGLPFVFAGWAIGPGARPAPFRRSRRIGADAIDDVVAAAEKGAPLPPGEMRAYLTRDLHHDLGPEDEAGLDEFLARARRADILPGHASISWTTEEDEREPVSEDGSDRP
jgi:chorismate dehydratase